jgi:hypothetical protein
MKKKTVLALAATIYLALVVSVHAGIMEESAVLERSYVPALALTNQPDKPLVAVVEAMRRFTAGWNRFVQNITAIDQKNPALKEAIAQSSASVKEAEGLVTAGKRKDAHEALETVRMVFWKARTDMGITYLPDMFTAFHEPMEEFADIASKSGTDLSTLKVPLNNLSDLWKNVENNPLDVQLFRVSPERAAKYREQITKQREILVQLMGLIETGNREALAKVTGMMKANFAQAFFVFGDFSGLQ